MQTHDIVSNLYILKLTYQILSTRSFRFIIIILYKKIVVDKSFEFVDI
jgi:hypothetical protein